MEERKGGGEEGLMACSISNAEDDRLANGDRGASADANARSRGDKLYLGSGSCSLQKALGGVDGHNLGVHIDVRHHVLMEGDQKASGDGSNSDGGEVRAHS